ncbi:MAG: hypothetical protein GX811_08600, partial [Lentisphaerae bacterium]|nr:hypothetical protein [Lentisphaerota bacterium]
MTWSDVEGAGEFELWRNETDDQETAVRYVLQSETSFEDFEVVKGLSYFYWVKARNENTVSPFSEGAEGYTIRGLADISVNDFVYLPTTSAAGNVPEVISMTLGNHGTEAMIDSTSIVAINIYLAEKPYHRPELDIPVG